MLGRIASGWATILVLAGFTLLGGGVFAGQYQAPLLGSLQSTPSPSSSPSAATPGASSVFTADDGWSVSINFAFWDREEATTAGNEVSLWAPNAGTMSVDTVDPTFTLPRGLSGASLTFTDTRECMPWIKSSFPELTIAVAADGSELLEESDERSRAVYISGVDDQTVFYNECRMLVPGESYVWIFGSAPNMTQFNRMFPEIVAMSESLTIPGSPATPTGGA